MGWDIQAARGDHCWTPAMPSVCFFNCSREEVVMDHLCPCAWGKIPSCSETQFNDLFYCMAVEVHVDIFFKSKSISSAPGFCLLLKIIICQPWWPFFNIAAVLWRYSEKHLEKLEGQLQPVPMLQHSYSLWLSPPFVGPGEKELMGRFHNILQHNNQSW